MRPTIGTPAVRPAVRPANPQNVIGAAALGCGGGGCVLAEAAQRLHDKGQRLLNQARRLP